MKSLTRIIILAVFIICSWVIANEILVPGMFGNTYHIILQKPVLFLAVILSPLVSFLAGAMVWNKVLGIYGYKANTATLTKYVIGDFSMSFLVPFFGVVGRSARVILLTSSGVKASVSFSSVIVDGLVFAVQALIAMGMVVLLGDFGILNLEPTIMFWLKTFFWLTIAGFIFFLVVARLKWIKDVQAVVQRITTWEKLINFLDGLNDGFLKVFAIPRKALLLITLWVSIWYVGGLIEVLVLANLIGQNLDLKALLLLQFAISTLFVVLPNVLPLGIGTMDALIAGVFLSTGLNIGLASQFATFWRLKSITYAVIGIPLVGESVLAKLNLFEIFKRKKGSKQPLSFFYYGLH